MSLCLTEEGVDVNYGGLVPMSVTNLARFPSEGFVCFVFLSFFDSLLRPLLCHLPFVRYAME